jgi:holo-[acyl-carrier protein] synthase
VEAMWAFEVVRFGPGTDAAGLVANPASAFTRAERLRSATGTTVRHWAGRLAAKRAVLRLLAVEETDDALGAVEILPKPAVTCRRSRSCHHGHPPAAALTGRVAEAASRKGVAAIEISISHERDLATAVAFAPCREGTIRTGEGSLVDIGPREVRA